MIPPNEIKINILIPTLVERKASFDMLTKKLRYLIGDEPVAILDARDNRENTIGAKRNQLLRASYAPYICFVDDDDDVADNYIEKLLEAADSGLDCASLNGIITFDGRAPQRFEHSIRYDHYTDVGHYKRPPNHLNLIRREIAIKFEFPEKNHGEDTDWAMMICEARVLKTEFYIPETLYYYKYIAIK